MSPIIPGFAKVRVNARTKLVRITSETASRVTGWRVTREGEKWERVNATGVTQELVICTPADIVCRMVLNTHYGELEQADAG